MLPRPILSFPYSFFQWSLFSYWFSYTDHCYHLIEDIETNILFGGPGDDRIDYPADRGIFGNYQIPANSDLSPDFIGPPVAVCGYNYGWNTRTTPATYSWANADGSLNTNVTSSAPNGNCPGDVFGMEPPYSPSTRPTSQYIPCTSDADAGAECALGWGNYWEIFDFESAGCYLGRLYSFAGLNDRDRIWIYTGSLN